MRSDTDDPGAVESSGGKFCRISRILFSPIKIAAGGIVADMQRPLLKSSERNKC